jgi:HEAT repeat protein
MNMKRLRALFSRNRLLTFAGVAAVFVGLAMLHPYPRQSLFGPTIRGKPRCFWEAEIRRSVLGERPIFERTMNWFGAESSTMTLQELFDDAEMLPLVLEMMDDPDYMMQHAGIGNLTIFPALRDPAALPALRKQLDGDDLGLRLLAARAIWLIAKDKTVFPVLLKPLDDPEPGIRAAGMMHLAAMAADAPELYPEILARKTDPNPRVRAPVMYAMANFKEKGVPHLIDGLNDADAEVRVAAVIALDSLDRQVAKAAQSNLEARLSDANRDVRDLATATLQRIDPERYKHLKGTTK